MGGVIMLISTLFFLFVSSGCSILTGFDVDGRPIIYMRPGRENTETSPRQLRHLVYILCGLFPPRTALHRLNDPATGNARKT